MSITSFFKSLINPEAMGEEIITLQERAYRQATDMYPGADPHILLSQVWLSRMASRGANPTDPQMQSTAFSETMQFACVPPPKNVRALGIYFIYKERPDIVQNFSKFANEFDAIMAPVFSAMENGNIDSLYRKFNPQLGNKDSAESCQKDRFSGSINTVPVKQQSNSESTKPQFYSVESNVELYKDGISVFRYVKREKLLDKSDPKGELILSWHTVKFREKVPYEEVAAMSSSFTKNKKDGRLIEHIDLVNDQDGTKGYLSKWQFPDGSYIAESYTYDASAIK